jgi:hypothetical protein
MKGPPSLRFRIEIALGALSAVMLVATMISPDWIERISGMAPDGGDGSAEWGATAAFAVATLVFLSDAGRMWWRAERAA